MQGVCCKLPELGKLETFGPMGQAHKGVSQVPQTIIFTVNPVSVFQAIHLD